MKKKLSIWGLLFGLFVCVITFGACGGDGNEQDYSNSAYYLSYMGEEQAPYLDWDNSMKTSWLRLQFEEGIPKGAEWNLYCGESWVKIRNTNGKVNAYSENIPVTIEDNTNYEDREASIYLDVDNGIPASSKYTTVVIHQYGYEFYLDCGNEISFDTDRSMAVGSTLELNIQSMDNVVEIDWGDNQKDVFNENESYSKLRHEYSSTSSTIRVKIRFGAKIKDGTAISVFSFFTNADQGITTFYDRNGNALQTFFNSATIKYVKYKDNKFTFDQL